MSKVIVVTRAGSGLGALSARRLAALEPDVAKRIVAVVDMPHRTRPFRVFVDPMNDGAEVVSAVADRLRVECFRRAGITELLGAQPSL